MKLLATILTLATSAVGSSLLAQDHSVAFDDSDTIWVASDVIIPSKIGLVIPMLNYVRFEDGRFKDGFASRSPEAIPSSCMPFDGRCLVGRNRADHYAGTYRILTDGLVLANTKRSDYFFDSGRADTAIEAFTFFGSMGSVPPKIQDGFMLHTTAAGEVRYVPLSPDGLDKIFGLASFGDYSLALNEHATCLIDLVHKLEKSDPTDGPLSERQLSYFSWLAAKMFRNNSRSERLSAEKTRHGDDIPEADLDEAAGLTVLRIAMDTYINNVVALGNDGVQPLTEDQRRVVLTSTKTEMSNLLERLPMAAHSKFSTSWDSLYNDLTEAVPLIAALKTQQINYENAICPLNDD